MSKKCFITKKQMVNTNVIISSYSGNKFKISKLMSFAHNYYFKTNFNFTILLYMFFLKIKILWLLLVYVLCKKCVFAYKSTPNTSFKQILKNSWLTHGNIQYYSTPQHGDTVEDSEMSCEQFLFLLMKIIKKIAFNFRRVLVHNKKNCL